MSKTTPTQPNPTNEALIEFFDDVIDHVTMAKHLRRSNYILALTVIRNDENKNCIDEDWADDVFYWLNELAEILDPNLTK